MSICRVVRGSVVLGLASLCAATALRAQGSCAVQGQVTDAQSGAAIVGAEIELRGEEAPVRGLTGATGRFCIDAPPGTYALVVTRTGFRDVARPVMVTDATISVDVALRASATGMDAVVVTASRRAERAQDAPASVAVVGAPEIEARAAISPADHLRTVPGVDIAQNGALASNVVVRGFNAAFSSSLHLLSDYRIAAVPGLQVNRFGSLAVGEDTDRIEVVLGPGAALYGPNTANGVVHILSKSALDDPGTTVSGTVGTRDAVGASVRSAHALRPNLGIKLSASTVRASEWAFTDTTEARLRGTAQGQIAAFRNAAELLGMSERQVDDSIDRDPGLRALSLVGHRPDVARRTTADARLDWHPAGGAEVVLQAGQSSVTGADLSGIGAIVQEDYRVSYYQSRLSRGRLFAQAYIERGHSGDSYTARSGERVTDRSSLSVVQLQHGTDFRDGRQRFTYGIDVVHTRPDSRGTIYGGNEGDDNHTQAGAYLQSESQVLPGLSLVGAGRLDRHSVLDNVIFSPRLGLVYTPSRSQTFRATWNQAFQAPTVSNLFIDRVAARAGPYTIRAVATGTRGFDFRLPGGAIGIRSPFNPADQGGSGTRIAYDAATLSALAINYLVATQRLTATEGAELRQAMPVFTVLGRNAQTGRTTPFDPAAVSDIDGLREEQSDVLEAGYRGLIGGSLLVTADLWHLRRRNFISQLFAPAPLLTVDAASVREFLAARGMTADRAGTLAAAAAAAPLAVVAAGRTDAYTDGVPILLTYKNYADVALTGFDFGLQASRGSWRLGATTSLVSDNYFEFPGDQPISLNTPRAKGSVTIGYEEANLRAELSGQHTAEFPVYSGVYVGNSCVDAVAGAGACVKAYTGLDALVSYALPFPGGPSIHVAATNLLGTRHRSFAGVPGVGRTVLVRATARIP